MNRYCKLLSISWLLVVALNANSQTESKPQESKKSVFESVWLWQIDTPSRRIYLAGELHNHAVSSNENLSHRLAYAAYDLSSHVLTEALDINKLSNDLLRHRLTATTWAELNAAIRTSVTGKLNANKNLSSAQRAVPIDDVINVIDRMPDERLFRTLPDILRPLPEKNDDFKNEIGFLKKIYSNKNGRNQSKQSLIEKPENFWSKTCSKPSDTESFIREILIETGPNAEKTERRIQELANEFRNPDATTASLNTTVENSPLWNILNKCTVLPRNIEWIKKIKSQLGKDNRPLMVVAGAGHVVGETGLLALLCKEGFCNSKRIQLIDLPKQP